MVPGRLGWFSGLFLLFEPDRLDSLVIAFADNDYGGPRAASLAARENARTRFG
jgi:hypothetical protein